MLGGGGRRRHAQFACCSLPSQEQKRGEREIQPNQAFTQLQKRVSAGNIIDHVTRTKAFDLCFKRLLKIQPEILMTHFVFLIHPEHWLGGDLPFLKEPHECTKETRREGMQLT